MLREVVGFLRCPSCGRDLVLADGTVRCGAGHGFDVARQGYVSLLSGGARTGTADTAAMVQARASFLGAGHYAAIAEAVADECERAAGDGPGGCVVDVGAGTGYHLARALDRLPDPVGVALDLSKHAARRAARAHPRAGAVVCDVWEPLPVRSGVTAVVLNVFAPRNGAEMARVLAPGGALVVVTPTRRHLAELVGPLGLLTVDERKAERLDAQLGPFVTLTERRAVEQRLLLSRADVQALVGMGPSARHGARVGDLPEPATVTVSVTVAVYRSVTGAAGP